MCPKLNHTKTETLISSNSTFKDRLKSKILGLHRVTILAIIFYIIFVIIFIFVNVLSFIWNMRINRKKDFITTKNYLEEKTRTNEHLHEPLSGHDEVESETSFVDEQNSLLDRLGVKIDDSLRDIFTAYVIRSSYKILLIYFDI
jgi:hypothetical protein